MTAKRKKNRSYKDMATHVASCLTKDELVELAELLDGDGGNDFCHFIQVECKKVAPELYADPPDLAPKIPSISSNLKDLWPEGKPKSKGWRCNSCGADETSKERCVKCAHL